MRQSPFFEMSIMWGLHTNYLVHQAGGYLRFQKYEATRNFSTAPWGGMFLHRRVTSQQVKCLVQDDNKNLPGQGSNPDHLAY